MKFLIQMRIRNHKREVGKETLNLSFNKKSETKLWSAIRTFMTFFSVVRLCMKFNNFFEFIKLSLLKTILTSYNVSVIRLLRIPHKTLSRPSIKSACVLKKVYLG